MTRHIVQEMDLTSSKLLSQSRRTYVVRTCARKCLVGRCQILSQTAKLPNVWRVNSTRLLLVSYAIMLFIHRGFLILCLYCVLYFFRSASDTPPVRTHGAVACLINISQRVAVFSKGTRIKAYPGATHTWTTGVPFGRGRMVRARDTTRAAQFNDSCERSAKLHQDEF